MKAIYINIDAAVRAVLAGETPAQPQVPLAVTIPAGQSAAVFAQTGTGTKTADAGSNVTGITWTFSPSLGDAIASSVSPGMSQVLSSESANVYAVTGGAFTATAAIKNSDTTLATVVIDVLVRREQAQGPVDLVDFAPPAAAPTAAQINTALGGTGAAEGQPLKGVDLAGSIADAAAVRSALVAAGNTSLAGVKLGGAIIRAVVGGGTSNTLADDTFDGSNPVSICLTNTTAQAIGTLDS